jgi:hypothetical protein
MPSIGFILKIKLPPHYNFVLVQLHGAEHGDGIRGLFRPILASRFGHHPDWLTHFAQLPFYFTTPCNLACKNFQFVINAIKILCL